LTQTDSLEPFHCLPEGLAWDITAGAIKVEGAGLRPLKVVLYVTAPEGLIAILRYPE
jgi:hypothetical protein